MECFVSTEIELDWKGFAWFGEVLMAKKTDMQQQVIIKASGTGCVTQGKKDINIKLERECFPADFKHEEYEIIAWRGKNPENHIINN